MGTRGTTLSLYGRRVIVLLNGPPGVGKDTIGKTLSDTWIFHSASFKSRLIDIALLVSGVSRLEWNARYMQRELKETPWDKLGGLSQRDYLIHISEEWVKPTHGEDYFGQAAVQNIKGCNNAVFTDSGFPLEVYPLIEAGYEVHIFRLHREGFTFKGDSRNYVVDVEGAFEHDLILSDGKPEVAVEQILNMLSGYNVKNENQCDGCRRGLDKVGGLHVLLDRRACMGCTSHLYK